MALRKNSLRYLQASLRTLMIDAKEEEKIVELNIISRGFFRRAFEAFFNMKDFKRNFEWKQSILRRERKVKLFRKREGDCVRGTADKRFFRETSRLVCFAFNLKINYCKVSCCCKKFKIAKTLIFHAFKEKAFLKLSTKF